MIVLLAFCFGCVAGSLFTQYWPKLKPSIAKALGTVFGEKPAPAKAAPKGHVSAAPIVESAQRQAPTIGTVLKHFGQFFGWCLRHWKLIGCIILALLLLSFLKACNGPFEFGKSKEQLRLENELAQSQARVHELETARDAEIATISRDVAVIRNQIRAESQRGHDEIAAATPEFEAPISLELSTAWRNSLERLRNACSNQTSAYPCGSEPSR